MQTSSVIIASCLVVLSLAHSILGEKDILQPLFRSSWDEPAPRWAMERILRFAWHLTSLAWLGIAAAALGLDIYYSAALVALPSAAIVFVLLRGHLAWPFFALAGLAALHHKGALSTPLLNAAIAITLTCIVSIGALHIYWAAGGRWGLSAAIPTTGDKPAFTPPRYATLLVAAALFFFAFLVAWAWQGASLPTVARLMLYGAIAVLTVRAIGDGKHVGFSKTQRNSQFAQWDDRLFTPLSVLMAFGSGAALIA